MDNTHSSVVYSSWKRLQSLIDQKTFEFDGENLDVSMVLAVARYKCVPTIRQDSNVLARIESSVSTLNKHLEDGNSVYGVNTGVGGSADSRTKHIEALQRSLLQHHQCGVLTRIGNGSLSRDDDELGTHSLPATWVKGAMLIRCNSLVRGHSGVSYKVIEAIVKLLGTDLIPVVPLRGSISASGDLMPLSYIAGTLEGNPDIWINSRKGDRFQLISAKEALAQLGIEPITLQAKEALGLMNGTAPSAAVASIALYESHHLALLAQILTAIAVEAMQGQAESFHPFIAQVRPHAGQVEVAKNILMLLQGSRLANGVTTNTDGQRKGLYQDRYALRTSPQWVGPQLEDLLLADRQISVELNSTTDNPLIDTASQEILSGGNFQAASITSAMEKTRSSLQMLGKMLFAQCTELINPSLNNGLPPNLCTDDPSLSFTMKGLDVSMAAYMSELTFLASPVSFHSQSAEMNNQAINSLALIAARATMQAVEVLSLMCATHLYVTCQALDLRVLHRQFLRDIQTVISTVTTTALGKHVASDSDIAAFSDHACTQISEAWWTASTLDLHARCLHVVDSCMNVTSKAFTPIISALSVDGTLEPIERWREEMIAALQDKFVEFRRSFSASPSTREFLGQGAGRMYDFVRQELQVPFHQGLVDHPSAEGELKIEEQRADSRQKTIGSWISVIYESLRKGDMHRPAMSCLNLDSERREGEAERAV
ncbi:MAG: hypothetical protein Q9191_005790 [Dirinaria sp. TL-2023a]